MARSRTHPPAAPVDAAYERGASEPAKPPLDEAAIERLVRERAPRLLAVARRFVSSEDDARDVLQEALLSAFRSIDGFEEGARLSTWLHRIVVNAALTKLRAIRRRREEAIEDFLPRFDERGARQGTGATWAESVADELEKREVRAHVRASIDRLPEIYRIVLLLRDIEDLPTAEVASLLDLSRSVVKVRLHRARQALRELLAPAFARRTP